jgi:hypothetical protein
MRMRTKTLGVHGGHSPVPFGECNEKSNKRDMEAGRSEKIHVEFETTCAACHNIKI